MKRFFALLLVFVLVVPVLSFADPAEPSDKYQTYGRTEDINNIFPGNYFSIEMFMSFDLNAYLLITTWNDHDATTMTKHAKIKAKVGDMETLYLVFADESYYTFHYDDENHVALWLDIDGVSIKMTYCQWLIPSTEVKIEQ